MRTTRTLGLFSILIAAPVAAIASCGGDGDTGSQSSSSSGGIAGAGGGGTGGSGSGGSLFGDAGACSSAADCNGGVCVNGICCDSAANACGGACCSGGTVCLFDKCVMPGKNCFTANDCGPGQYCETALGEQQGGAGGAGGAGSMCTQPLPQGGKCLDLPPKCDANGQPAGCVEACEYKPPGDVPLNAIAEWSWGANAVDSPEHVDVWATPAVGRVFDGNCDGKVDELDSPNIIFVSGRAIHATTGKGTCCQCTTGAVSACKSGVLRMLDGRTGKEIWSLKNADDANSIGFMGLSVAIGDIDLDNRMDIAAVTGEGYLVLLDANGKLLRKSDLTVPGFNTNAFGWGGGLSIADMDLDGYPEIAYGATVFATTGGALTLKWTGAAGIGGQNVQTALSTFVDLDGAPDGHLELLAGRTAYKSDGTILWDRADLTDGFPAVGDFDKDGKPEMALVRQGNLHILNGLDGTDKWTALKIPGTGTGGPPTVADFDGDGFPEVGVALATFYSVLKPDLVNNTLNVLWSTANHDLSSSVTGSSVFDFEGDGRAEVIYNDECFVWVYDGQTGNVRFAAPTTSFTATEASLVADVDGDGRSEIVMISNSADPSSAGWGCMDANGNPSVVNGVAWTPGTQLGQSYRGITVYGDKANSWVGTRTLWSEHTYHVSNICDNRDSACDMPNIYGSIPKGEKNNWTVPWLNNFRQNVQDKGIFDAPDITLSLTVDCSAPVNAQVSVRNIGLASLPAGADIGVYKQDGAMEVLVGQTVTTQTLFPGQTQVIALALDPVLAGQVDTFIARVLLDPMNPKFHECREDNNFSMPVKPSCVN